MGRKRLRDTRARANDRRYYWANREKINAKRRGKYSDAKRKYQRRYRAKHRQKYLEYGRRRYRLKRAELIAYQQNRRRKKQEELAGRPRPSACEVCGRPTGVKEIAFDHCHRTGRFRGWLCGGCNLAIGNVREDPERLRKLAAYLEHNRFEPMEGTHGTEDQTQDNAQTA
jgi:hypothetical protein